MAATELDSYQIEPTTNRLFRKFVGDNPELVDLGVLLKEITGLSLFH